MMAITVTSLGDDPGGIEAGISLREAILQASPGETIDFAVTGTIQLESQLEIGKSLTISGPGSDLLTIQGYSGGDSAGDGHRIFSIVNLLEGTDVTISGLRLAGGDVAGEGGAIRNEEFLTIENCLITDNAATAGGGAIYSYFGNLNVVSSVISGNSTTSGGNGGGLHVFGGVVSIDRSFIRGNTASGSVGGGIFATAGAQLEITNSTIAFNRAESGGGINVDQSNVETSNVTISGNRANVNGGGVRIGLLAINNVDFRHTTIADNHSDGDDDAFGDGGGIYVDTSFSNQVPDLNHTIVAGNYKGSGNNLAADIVGSWSGEYFIVNADAMLGPLSYNGSDVPTHVPLPGSPALDEGDPNAVAGVGSVPLTDARGAGFTRVFDGNGVDGARIDIGAHELQTGSDPVSLVVDILLDEEDGDYTVGDLSLREAIGLANRNHGVEDTIIFAETLFGGTIVLTLGELAITDSLAILGLGSRFLTIDASGNDLSAVAGDGSRIFNVDDGNPEVNSVVTIQGLKLVGGDSYGGGGAIRNHEDLTVSECEISGNSAVANGGGILAIDGTLSVADSIISGNSSHKDYATYGGGGGIATFSYLKLASSAVFGNVSDHHGGGIFAGDGKLNVTNSTISGNAAGNSLVNVNPYGGGIFIGQEVGPGYNDVRIVHTTITRNSALSGGAGISLHNTELSSIDISHTIVAGNMSSDLGGRPMDHEFSLVGGDPLLGPLGYHGGRTPTHAPLAGSPAIDNGDSSAQPGVSGTPQFDQRGVFHTRVAGMSIDIGAHESQPPPLAGDANGDLIVDAADYTVWRNHSGQNVGVYTSGDLDGNGLVNQFDYAIWKSNFGNSLDGAGAGATSAARTLSTSVESGAGSSGTLISGGGNDAPVLAPSVEIVEQPTAMLESVASISSVVDQGHSTNWAVPLETRVRTTDGGEPRRRQPRMDFAGPRARDLLLETLGGDERRVDRQWWNDDSDCHPKDREVDDALVDSAIDALDSETGPPGVFGRRYRLRL